MFGGQPAGRYAIRTSRVTGMGPETIIGPRREFAFGQLGPVETRDLPVPASVEE